MDADVKGDIYEGLLAKSAAESPKGAGQYFTQKTNSLIRSHRLNDDVPLRLPTLRSIATPKPSAAGFPSESAMLASEPPDVRHSGTLTADTLT